MQVAGRIWAVVLAASALGLCGAGGPGPETVAGRLASVRRAVMHLQARFGSRYGQAGQWLRRLDALQKQLEGESGGAGRVASDGGGGAAAAAVAKQLDRLARQALLANPLLTDRPILFVTRHQYKRDHHNTATFFQNGARNAGNYRGGSTLKMLDLSAGGKVTVLLQAPQGLIRDPELSFDGTTVLFSFRRNKGDDQHIYRMNLDGSGLTQLSAGAGIADTDPVFLADGSILFSSSRVPKECPCNVHPQQNLFVMDADGGNIRQITFNTVSETHPWLMPDGRVLYSRWEYVDKHWGPAQGLWTMRPDGTRATAFYGMHAWWPGAVLDGRLVPGRPWLICTLGSCHAPPFGEIAIVDPRIGRDGQQPIVKSWPQQPVQRNGYDHVWNLPLRYEDPYPLDDTFFLASRTIKGKDDRYGIFLLDMFGNETLVYADAELSCFDPMPVRPRRRPPLLPAQADLTGKYGQFIAADVYRGSGMERVKRGTVKWLRVVEVPSKLTSSFGDYNHGARQAPAANWSDTNIKRPLGRVPVEPDGSASFYVPADRFVYFQLLDADGMMVQSMRSGTVVRPGEVAGCVGCHEDRHQAGLNRSLLALGRPPSRLLPDTVSPHTFCYARDVQPVFDRYCVRCHDVTQPAGRELDLCGDKTLAFNVSYQELLRKSEGSAAGKAGRLVDVVHLGPPQPLPPYSWGSHRSRLVRVLRDGHYDVKLDPESLARLVTWIDLNAPYYPTYAATWVHNYGGRSPLSDDQIARLKQLTGVDITNPLKSHMVNLTRPEFSRVLLVNLPESAGGWARPGQGRFGSRSDPGYRQALAILRAGASALAARPRMDMPGGRPDPLWEQFRRRLARFQQLEAAARRAVAARQPASHLP